MLTIRSYSAADCDATIDIFQRAIRLVASRDYDPTQIAAWSTITGREAWGKRRASRPTWIVEHDGVPAGFADLEPDGHLDMMFVDPNHGRIGVASLLDTVESEGRRLGLQQIFTEASLTARPFFERRGFSVLERQTVESRGETFINFRMEKLLKP